jgi:lipopolysaccharide/colanic/teichoic acid biosynthesis glycosyltransferase
MNTTQIIDNKFNLDQTISRTGIPRWKRALDLALIFLALPLLVPIVIFISLLIRAVSDGPIIFQQERIGHLSRKFKCFKFRTMFVGSDEGKHRDHARALMQSNAPMAKMDAVGDARIIPFGRLLRVSGLDELPQLINVLRGEMSLVGPRPCLPYEFEHYLPHQRERVCALPGLTGLWQVKGKNKTTFDEMIHLDITYARHQTFVRDMTILCQTPGALLGQILDAQKRCKTPLRQAQLVSIIAFEHTGRSYLRPETNAHALNRSFDSSESSGQGRNQPNSSSSEIPLTSTS